jgi:hypothetical protein
MAILTITYNTVSAVIQTGLQRHFTLDFITYMSGIYESGEST